MSFKRTRYKDSRVSNSGTVLTELYRKVGGICTNPLAYEPYSTVNITRNTGSYTWMSDELVARYQSKSARGEVFFNPMSKIDWERSAFGTYSGEVEKPTVQCSGNGPYKQRYRFSSTIAAGLDRFHTETNMVLDSYGVPVLPTWVIPDATLDSLISEAATSVRARRGKSAGQWEALAELEKSAGMLNDAIKNAKQVISKKTKIIRRAQAAASAYLLYRYGVTPAIASVQHAAEGLSKAIGRVRETTRASVSDDSTSVTTGSKVTFSNYNTLYSITNKESLVVRAMSLDEYVATLGRNVGFSTKDLMSLPWELLPYSFVLDWVANIGDFIGAMLPDLGSENLGSCYVIERKLTRMIRTTGFTVVNAGDVFYTNPTNYGVDCSWTHKYRIAGLPGPSLVIRSDFKMDSITRALDAISLLTQQLGGSYSPRSSRRPRFNGPVIVPDGYTHL